MAFQPRNGYVYLTGYSRSGAPLNYDIGYTWIISGNSLLPTRIYLPEALPGFIAADPGQGWIYVTAEYTDSVFVISGTTLFGKVAVTEAGRIEVQPATGLAYIQSAEEDLVILNGTSRLGELQVGPIASMAAEPRSRYLYVSHPASPTVTIVSGTAVLTEVAVISPGGTLEVHPSTGLVYLRHPGASFVSILSGTEVLTRAALLGDGAIESNPVSGLVYAVEGPTTVAVLEGTHREGNLSVAFPQPRSMEFNSVSGQVVLLGTGTFPALSLIEGEEIVATVPLSFTPGPMIVHPSRGLIYLTAPEERAVQVMSGTALLASIPLPGEPQDIAVQPRNGLVYVPDSAGFLDVLDGTSLITLSLSDSRLAHVATDAERGWIYVTEGTKDVVHILTGTQVVTEVYLPWFLPGVDPGSIVVEPHSGYAYINDVERLWVLSSTGVISQITFWNKHVESMAVAPTSGYLYVEFGVGMFACTHIEVVRPLWEKEASWPLISSFSFLQPHPRSSYFYLGQDVYGSLLSIGVGATLVTTMTVGDGSWVRSMAVDTRTGQVYVATDHAIAVLEEYLPYRFYLPLVEKGGYGERR